MSWWRFVTGSEAPPRDWSWGEYSMLALRVASLVVIVVLVVRAL